MNTMNKTIYILSICVFSFVIYQGAHAQESATTSASEVRLNGTYFKHFLSDAGHIYSNPVRWNGKKWAKTAGVIGGTVALYLIADSEISKWSIRQESSFARTVADIAEPYGNGRFAIAYPVVTYLSGLALNNDRVKRTGLLLFESYILTGITYQASLYLFSRQRPDSGTPVELSFEGPSFKPKQSFISGHSAIAFAISTTLAIEFRDQKWVAPVVYSLATLTGLSRIYDNRHWSSDVFIGAIMGHFIAKSVMRKQFARDEKPIQSRVSMTPMLTPVGPGLSMQINLSTR
jgi:membrane-associated phospholipid phosphatase